MSPRSIVNPFSSLSTRPFALLLASIATIATIGSLYLSLGLGLIPCELCWYQRILMYPLIPILLYGAIKNEIFTGLVLTMSGIGTLISLYHSYIQITPSGDHACSSMCSIVMYTVGLFTIPNLAGIAFTLIFTGTLLQYHYQNE